MAAVGIVLHDARNEHGPFEVYASITGFLVAAPAAWLAFVFQLRQKYLADVQGLWRDMVRGVQEAIQYTHLNAWDADRYSAAHKSLSCSIDELRAVFLDLQDHGSRAGLYPFESLKAIHAEFSKLQARSFRPGEAKTCRDAIVAHWKTLRRDFLNEMSRGVPRNAESPYLI
jgi:hypothetical protein